MPPILPGSTIGFLGGGQLGRMTAMAARSFGYRSQVLDPDPSCPARFVVDACFEASWDDARAAADLARGCDVVTLEIEQVSLASLRAAQKFALVRPGPHVLEIIQDRIAQRAWLTRHGFPTGDHRPASTPAELAAALTAFEGSVFIKAARGGYDGRAQLRLRGGDLRGGERPRSSAGAPPVRALREQVGEIDPRLQPGDNPPIKEGASAPEGSSATPRLRDSATIFASDFRSQPVLVERALALELELSVLVARSPSGECVTYAPARNHHENGILEWSVLPAQLPPDISKQATELATAIAAQIDLEGLLVVEMFLLTDGRLLINELAPRPHNSYHTSQRACVTSQFEQHVRSICDLPLGSPLIIRPAAIVNLLGDSWLGAQPPNFAAALTVPEVRLHLYEKHLPKPGRKMGHLSATADTPQEALRRVLLAHRLLTT